MNVRVDLVISWQRRPRWHAVTCAVATGVLALSFLASAKGAPVVTLNVTPLHVPAGQRAVLTWSATGFPPTGSTTCNAYDAWAGTQPIAGSFWTAPTTPGSYTYALGCTNITDGLEVTQRATTTLTVTTNGFSYTDLVANLSGTGARTVDSSLEDPWGLAWQAKLPASARAIFLPSLVFR
jgi:hypothetical protein